MKVTGRVKDMVPFPEGALSGVSAGLRLLIWAPCLWHTLVLSQPAHVSVPEDPSVRNCWRLCICKQFLKGLSTKKN